MTAAAGSGARALRSINKMNESTGRTSVSLMEIIGGYSALLILAVIIIGIVSLIVRRQRFSVFSTFATVGIGFAGLGATFWNLSAMNRMQLFHISSVDPDSWLADFSVSCASAGAVLPACGISMVLIGLSFLLQKSNTKKIEQVAAPNP